MTNKTFYIWWLTITASLGGFLFGYDTAVISGTLSMVREKFALNATFEGWYVSSALVGCILGVLFAGWMSDKYGRKKVLLLSATLFSISAFGCSLINSFSTLIIYRFVGGLGVGIASMLSPMYISEISPPKIRGKLVALYQLAITAGILASYLVNAWLLKQASGYGVLNSEIFTLIFKQEVWRAMLGMEALPALLFFLLLMFVPESPRWLIVKGMAGKAKSILLKTAVENEANAEIQEIESSLVVEKKSKNLVLEPGIKLALFLGVSLAVLQQFTGIDAIIYYGPRIMESAGFALSDALGSQVVIGAINMSFTLLAIWQIDRFGRKPLLLFGTSGMFLALLVIGQFIPLSLDNLGPSVTFWIFALFCIPTIVIGWKIMPETKGRSLEFIEKYWMEKQFIKTKEDN